MFSGENYLKIARGGVNLRWAGLSADRKQLLFNQFGFYPESDAEHDLLFRTLIDEYGADVVVRALIHPTLHFTPPVYAC